MRVATILEKLASETAVPEGRGTGPFKLAHTFGAPAGRSEIEEAWGNADLPDDLLELWASASTLRLFEDIEYGQWGLVLLSPLLSAARTAKERRSRPEDFKDGDVVIGEFLGDLELLVVARDGQVLVALPLDSRSDWYAPAQSVASFVERYSEQAGNKFWE